MAIPPRTSPYLDGNFAPVTDEVDVVDLAVTGTIPRHLDGRYLRNGPNPARAVEPATYHWFTGDGMVHGLRLRDGKAEWYRNRWVRSAGVAEALGEPPRPTLEFDFAANTNVIGHAGRTFAIVEGGSSPYELTDELDTVGPCDFAGTLPQGYTAHPKRDPDTGELHAVSYHWARPEVLEYTVIGTDARVRHRVDVPVPGNPMVHDCSITERHVVLYDRWWNPAVEDQARDRAWRIGQTKTVVSHRLVCPGTVDERVEEVVAGKRHIADLVLPKSSSLSDLDADQLRVALGLRSDTLLTEDAT